MRDRATWTRRIAAAAIAAAALAISAGTVSPAAADGSHWSAPHLASNGWGSASPHAIFWDGVAPDGYAWD